MFRKFSGFSCRIFMYDIDFILRRKDLTEKQQSFADAKNDGMITAGDARLILRWSVGIY